MGNPSSNKRTAIKFSSIGREALSLRGGLSSRHLQPSDDLEMRLIEGPSHRASTDDFPDQKSQPVTAVRMRSYDPEGTASEDSYLVVFTETGKVGRISAGAALASGCLSPVNDDNGEIVGYDWTARTMSFDAKRSTVTVDESSAVEAEA